MIDIRVTPAAVKDLVQIKSYIECDLANPVAAKNAIKRIVDDYTLLKSAPLIGRSLSDKVNFKTDYRYIVSGNYLIFYKVDDKYISIYRILNGRQDYMKIIFDDVWTTDE